MNNIISTRIRFARNLSDYPFPVKLGNKRRELMFKVRDVAKKIYPDFDFIDAEALTNIQEGAMIEQHLISPEFAEQKNGSGILLSKDRSVCIMINEEDHLRIQVFSNGENIKQTYEKAKEIDEKLDSELHFTYSESFGYLTQCPTNLGTAMRASVLVHLPLITEYNSVGNMTSLVNKYGLTVRGLYGEGSQANGCMYQISNSISLGYTEEDIIDRIVSVVNAVIKSEETLASKISSNIAVQDRVYRAYGILKNSRIITSAEATELLSAVRCGVEAGIIDISPKIIDKLLIDVQPYNIMIKSPENRDVFRAELIRKSLE